MQGLEIQSLIIPDIHLLVTTYAVKVGQALHIMSKLLLATETGLEEFHHYQRVSVDRDRGRSTLWLCKACIIMRVGIFIILRLSEGEITYNPTARFLGQRGKKPKETSILPPLSPSFHIF